MPLERVRAALAAPGMVALSAVPGALEGLGAEHLVQEGAPMLPPREVSGAGCLVLPLGALPCCLYSVA